MALNFYDQQGTPIAYTDDGEYIYLFSGEPVAYISGDSIYGYSGRHMGWCKGGWILDHNGNHVYFSEDAIGGPIKPIRSLSPLKGIKGIRPIKGIPEVKPIPPIKSLIWSDLYGDDFFID